MLLSQDSYYSVSAGGVIQFPVSKTVALIGPASSSNVMIGPASKTVATIGPDSSTFAIPTN